MSRGVILLSTLATVKTEDGKFQRILRLKCPIHGHVGISVTANTMAQLNQRTPRGDYWCPVCNPNKLV